MELTIKGEPKEIAAFLLETGKRQEVYVEDVAKNLHGLLKDAVESYGTHLNQADQILSGDEIDPFRLPVVVALSARELDLLKVECAEKANRSQDDHKT